MNSGLKVELKKISKRRAKMILKHLKESLRSKADCGKHPTSSDWCHNNH